jgi:hypothetical protein
VAPRIFFSTSPFLTTTISTPSSSTG